MIKLIKFISLEGFEKPGILVKVKAWVISKPPENFREEFGQKTGFTKSFIS